MLQKPWPIIVIGICYIFAPIVNLFFSIFLSQASFVDYLSTFNNPRDIFEFYFILPIAGFSLLAFRWWSYPMFIAVFVWSLYYNYKSYAAYPAYYPLYLLVLFYFFNFLIVTYFIVPSVRAPYFNKRLRWWESKPRFTKDIKAQLSSSSASLQLEADIKNISEGGVLMFVLNKSALSNGSTIHLSFIVEGLCLSLEGEVVHVDTMGPSLVGIRFLESNSRSEKGKLRDLIKAYSLMNVPCKRPLQMTWGSFFSWLKTLFSTGKGVFPKIP